MTQKHYDLIVIGGGSGGLAAAESAAQLGQRVAIVEAGAMGGTCVQRGCVPKKIMWYAAHLSHAADDAADFGVRLQHQGVDWPALVAARSRYIDNITRYWDGYVHDSGIQRIQGHARFTAADAIDVDGQAYRADHIVIATGGRPLVPPVPGAALGITSDEFFNLQEAPRRVALIGGGYIGVELSGVLRALGAEISLFALEDRVLPHFDPLLSDTLMTEMDRTGIQRHMGFAVNRLSSTPNGISVHGSHGAVEDGFDTVIWAIGRVPNSRDLGLERAGVRIAANGSIAVDDYQNTNVAGIYAVGDVTGKAPLTPVAIAAGRRLGQRLFAGRDQAKLDYSLVPSVVFAHPPVATLGLTEAQAVAQYGADVGIYETQFTPMRHALSSNPGRTAMKLVCAGPEERIVGLHLIGEGADEILQGFAVAVQMGATKADLDATIAIHPTSAEELVTLKVRRPGQAAPSEQPLRATA